MVTEAQVRDALKGVTDPEFPISIVDMGMIYDVKVENKNVSVDMTFTAMGCPAIDMLIDDVKEALSDLPGISRVQVDVVWSPPWTKDKITSKGREILQYYGVGV